MIWSKANYHARCLSRCICVSTKVIGDQIDHGIAQFSWQGKHAERFNRITRAFYHSAAHGRFGSPTNLPLTLRDYRVYISYCAKAKNSTRPPLPS